MDCREATDFVHKKHLVDKRPFCLPYCQVPPSQYEKLRTALSENGIILKSQSEYVSPLYLYGRKMAVCTFVLTSDGSVQRP